MKTSGTRYKSSITCMKLQAFEKITDLLARQHKISIREGNTWAANIEERWVFYKKTDVYTLPDDHILGFLLHEVAHIHYTTNVKLPNKNKELHHLCMNMLEDHAIEHIISGDYPNAGEILDATRQEVLDILIRILPTHNAIKHEKALLYASARFEGRGYAHGVKDYEKTGEKISQIMIKKKNKILNRKKTADLLPITQEIIKILLKELGNLTEEEKHAIRQSNENNSQDSTGTGKQTRLKKAINEQLRAGTGWLGENWDIDTEATFLDNVGDQAAIVGRRLRSVLKRNNAMEFGGRFRTGKLIKKRLIRIRTVKDRKPFGRRIIKSNQSYAFVLAADISGSMTHASRSFRAMDCAMSAMYMTAAALRIAGVDRSLIVFGTNAIQINNPHKLALRWCDMNNKSEINKAGSSNTNIHKAIYLGQTILQKTMTEKKIILLLTDGGSDYHLMDQAKKDAEKQDIRTIVIGIGNEVHSIRMKEIFENDFIHIKDTGDAIGIGNAFIKVLKNTITKTPS